MSEKMDICNSKKGGENCFCFMHCNHCYIAFFSDLSVIEKR